MIISKDLFIFGEQIFATIIPEGGSITPPPTTQQQHQQQQQQQQQHSAIVPIAAPPTTTTTPAATPEKHVNNKHFADKIAAAENSVVDSFKKATTTTTTTATPAAPPSTTNLPLTAPIKLREQETLAVVVIGSDQQLRQQQHAAQEKAKNNKNNEAKLINKALEAAEGTTAAAVSEVKVVQGAAAAAVEKILKVKEPRATTTSLTLTESSTDEDEDEESDEHIKGATSATTIKATEQEPLVRRFTKIKLTPIATTTTTTATVTAATAAAATKTTAESSSLRLLVGDQQQQQQQRPNDCRFQLELPSFNEVPGIPATATTTTTAPATPPVIAAATATAAAAPSTEKTIKNLNSSDLSRKMRKVMLGNTASSDHTMVTFPFISEQHRTLQLTFQNISVVHNDRKILSDVSGLVSPGEVLAIMGPSGCGKTTLLDCLSGQRRFDGGSVYLNREPLSKKWRRKICYVLQEEIFFSGLTLRETVMYTALLRLPEKMPRTEKMKLVDRILEALELNFCQQTKFGDYLNRGLSGGEKKRANIACELLTNPLLMLLDEPTSGLDSHSAISLMKVLKRYAIQEQKTVVITVHQPSSQMFHMFDKLLLLYGGRTAYFGDVNNIYSYFEDIGVAIKPHYNPADFVLEQIKSYPDIREKLFIAAKESHSNYLNRNCITALSTNINNHHNIPNGNGAIPNNYINISPTSHGTANTNNTNGISRKSSNNTNGSLSPNNSNSNSTAITINNDKTLTHDTLITDIMHNFYQDKSNHNSHSHHMKHEDLVLINNHHNCADEEAAQQLWCGADSLSNFSSGSSDCHQYETADDWLDYPTSFLTQFRVLSSRNFKEAKPRMLSKLNWCQTIGLAFMAGAIWYKIPRTEGFLHDLQGWMFFSQTYWMLFALFGALNSFPSEREVISKERRSGAYRLSAYYLAKMFGELPLVMTLPTVYLMISYPMLGCSSFKLFFLMLVFLLLNTIVAQSVGFFIGACCMDMNVSITLSALYTLATQLFGGYLSSRIPEGLSWMRYTSMIHYAYQNMQILEFREGPAITCGNPSSYEICKNSTTTAAFIPYQEILKAQNSTSPLWLNTLILMMFFLVFRCLGYAVLRYWRCPKT